MSNISAIPTRDSTLSVAETSTKMVDEHQLRIGEILVRKGRMNDAGVQRVLQTQAETGGRFGEIAISLKLVTRDEVDQALATQFGYLKAGDGTGANLPAKIATAFQPASAYVESVRTLRSQLILRWFDGSPSQSALAVTSVDRGDGKSFITASLGVAFAQLGERTVIIDADMRHPTQHDIFGLENRMGLSAVLSGRAGRDEIRPLAGLPSLSILPSGALPPNPQELLGRPVFAHLLNELSSSFDVILLDTPSAQEASDAHVIAQRARACLLVGRKDKTRTRELSQLAAVYNNSGITVLGSTLNEY